MSSSFPWLSPLTIAFLALTIIGTHYWGRHRRARARAAKPAAAEVPFSEAITRAAGIPLLDAAHYLWTHRNRFDHEDRLIPKPFIKPDELRTDAGFRRAVQMAFARVAHENQIAPTPASTTFARLKKAHPEALDQDCAAAISTALAFERTYLSYDGQGPTEAKAAMRTAFPNYIESTYDSAYHHLRFVTR